MAKTLEIHLTEHQKMALESISRISRRTLNVTAHDCILFARRYALRSPTERLALRNEKASRQKDLYVGLGLTLDYFERSTGDRGQEQTVRAEPAASFHVEGDAIAALDDLVAARFAIDRYAAISLAIWLYREVVSALCDGSSCWQFGYVPSDDEFVEERIEWARPISEHQARRAVERIAHNLEIHPEKGLDDQDWDNVRNFFICADIAGKEKKKWAKKVIWNDPSLLTEILDLASALAVSSEEVDEIAISNTAAFPVTGLSTGYYPSGSPP